MIRFILWTIFFFVVWKLLRSLFTPTQRHTPPSSNTIRQSGSSFQHVQDAEFEDITKQSSADTQSSSEK